MNANHSKIIAILGIILALAAVLFAGIWLSSLGPEIKTTPALTPTASLAPALPQAPPLTEMPEASAAPPLPTPIGLVKMNTAVLIKAVNEYDDIDDSRESIYSRVAGDRRFYLGYLTNAQLDAFLKAEDDEEITFVPLSGYGDDNHFYGIAKKLLSPIMIDEISPDMGCSSADVAALTISLSHPHFNYASIHRTVLSSTDMLTMYALVLPKKRTVVMDDGTLLVAHKIVYVIPDFQLRESWLAVEAKPLNGERQPFGYYLDDNGQLTYAGSEFFAIPRVVRVQMLIQLDDALNIPWNDPERAHTNLLITYPHDLALENVEKGFAWQKAIDPDNTGINTFLNGEMPPDAFTFVPSTLGIEIRWANESGATGAPDLEKRLGYDLGEVIQCLEK